MTMQIPGYEIKRELGRGGMATVYLAEQVLLKRSVAIKIMSLALGEDPSFRDRFLKEGQIVAKLEHPGIVKIYEINVIGDLHYIVMELVPGGSLQERLLQGLSVDVVVNVISQIADVLGFALEHGYIHRDIKPANILFRADGTPVLTDFGIAKEIAGASGTTKTGTAMGTPTYMSPEQALGQSVDGRSDLYSLGVMFYEMLVGQPPYHADSPIATALMHVTEPIPRLPERVAFFQPVIDGILAKDPRQRYASGDEFLEALNHSLAAAPDATRELILKGAPPPLLHTRAMTYLPRRRRWLKPVIAVAGLAFILVIGMWLLLRPAPLTPVQNLLNIAAQQLTAGNLLTPEADNAYATYRKVLELEPGNPQAAAGVSQVVEQLALRALAAQQQGKLDEAQAVVRQGLEIQADHPGLLSVHRTLQERIISQKREAEILVRLEQAAREARAGRWFEPTGAVAGYRSVLELDPNNAAALAALNTHADALAAQARTAQASGQLEIAQQVLTQALTLRPGDPALLTLQQELLQKREQGQLQARLDALVQRARQQTGQGKLGKPPGDNAYETYQTVLALDPSNATAKAGIRDLADKQLALVRAAHTRGKLDEAVDLLAQGLLFAPEHPGLKLLGNTLQAALEKRRQDEQARLQREADTARLAQEKIERERQEKARKTQEDQDARLREQREALARREEELRKQQAAAAAQVKGAQRVGTVSRVDAEWGFVVVQLDANAAVKVGERLQLKPGNKVLTVKRVSDRTVSALPEGGLTGITAGMEIWSN